MHAIVSLVDEEHSRAIESLWSELEHNFGLKGVRVTPLPHFSWSVTKDFKCAELEVVLQKLSSSIKPLRITTTGIGLFTGDKPVIYLPVIKTVELMRYHALIWDLTASACHERSRYYSPENWMPHITIAYDDVTKNSIGPVMERLAFQRFDWEIGIDNIAVIYEPAGSVGMLKYKYRLTAGISV